MICNLHAIRLRLSPSVADYRATSPETGEELQSSERIFVGRTLVADGSAVAARVGAADPEAALGIDHDAVRVAREFVPVAPLIDDVAAPLHLRDRLGRKAALHMQRVAAFAQTEAAREEARRLQRLLHVAAMVDHGEVGL